MLPVLVVLDAIVVLGYESIGGGEFLKERIDQAVFVWTAAGGRENLVFGSSIANDRSDFKLFRGVGRS